MTNKPVAQTQSMGEAVDAAINYSLREIADDWYESRVDRLTPSQIRFMGVEVQSDPPDRSTTIIVQCQGPLINYVGTYRLRGTVHAENWDLNPHEF
jgi:hypothetical protein